MPSDELPPSAAPTSGWLTMSDAEWEKIAGDMSGRTKYAGREPLRDERLLAEARAQRSRAEAAERCMTGVLRRIESGTMHHPACNANHSKPLGGSACSCPNGVTIRRLREVNGKLVALCKSAIQEANDRGLYLPSSDIRLAALTGEGG